jgi:HK97 gp10 family phage protein
MLDAQITFTDDFSAGLDKLVADVETKVLASGAAGMAVTFYDEAKVQALKHYKSGTLYDAIYRVYAKDASKPDRVVYAVSWNHAKAPHGHLIEFGTSKAPAYPFLRPSFSVAPVAVQVGLARMATRMDSIASGRIDVPPVTSSAT